MRKIIGLILTIAMLCQVYIPVSAAGTNSKNMDMVVSLFQEIGVITLEEDQEFDAEATVSRAKFSEYLGKAIKVYPSFDMQYFNDVPFEHEQAEYINALTDSGIIAMNDAKVFDPERPIKYSEACKMLLYAMGYGDYAASKGKTMDVYVITAAEAGISITVKDQNAITAAEAMKLLFNAMNEPIMVHNFEQKASMSIDSTKNLFAEYHDIYFAKGVVESTFGAHLERYPMSDEGKIIISEKEFDTDLDLREYLGTRVEYAYRWNEDEDKGKVIYATICDEEDVLEIESSLLDDFDETTNTFYYLLNKDAKRLKKQKIENNFQIVYNGAPYSGTVTSVISDFLDSSKRGKISLTDSDQDGEFDVVIIKKYETLEMGTIDTVNQNIYGGAGKITIPYKDFEFVKLFDEKGEEKELLDYTNVVLSVAKSVDDKILEIVLNEQTLDITVKKVQFDDNEITADDGTIYLVDPDVMSQYGSTIMSSKTIKVSFDMYGYIVKIETGNTDDYLVGYLISGKSREGETLDVEMRLKIYTRNSKIEEYEFARKIIIDGTTYRMDKNPDVAINALPKTSLENDGHYIQYKVGPQVIRYKLNEDKQITAIDTTILTENEDKDNSLVQRHKGKALLNSNRVGLDTYWSTSETAVFKIPSLNNEGKVNKNNIWVDPEAKDFATTVSLSFDHTYTCDTYNYSDTDHYTDIMVVIQEQKTLTPETLIFTGTYTIWDEDECATLAVVECISSGSETTYKLNEGVERQIEQQGIKPGDMFYISVDPSGYGTDIKKIFDAETLTFNNGNKNDYWYYGEYSPYSNWSYRTGEDNRNNLSKMFVLKKRGTAVFGSYEKAGLASGTYEEIMNLGDVPVTIVYKDGKQFEKGNFNSILSYEEAGSAVSLILIESRLQIANSVIIYK